MELVFTAHRFIKKKIDTKTIETSSKALLMLVRKCSGTLLFCTSAFGSARHGARV